MVNDYRLSQLKDVTDKNLQLTIFGIIFNHLKLIFLDLLSINTE